MSADSGRRRLAGALGESAEGLGVAHGDVGQHLAVELDAGQLEAVYERAVAHAVLARGGVDTGDPEAAEVALAVAAVAGGGGVGPHYPFPWPPVRRGRPAPGTLRALEGGAALLAGVDGALDAGHRPWPPSSLITRLRSAGETSRSLRNERLRLGDFFSRMWLEKACRACTLPFAVTLKRFFAPEC